VICYSGGRTRFESEDELLRRIFGSRREATGGWRKVHTEGFHNLCSSPDSIRVM